MSIVTRRPALTAALLFFALSCGLSAGFVFANGWFGAGDLRAMSVWSGAAALTLIPFAVLLERLERGWRTGLIYLARAIGALMFTAVWIAALFAFLGPMVGAFSFPVPLIWLAASLIGLVVPVFMSARGAVPAAAAVILPILLALIVGRAATSAPPEILVIAKHGLPSADVQRIWTEVLGTPHPSGNGHDHLAGIGSVSAFDGQGETRLKVGFQPGTSSDRRDEIVRLVKQSPLVERVEEYDPTKHGTVDVRW